NAVAPQKVRNSLSADVLRLWCSATYYANEMSVSDDNLKRMADSYRRMRNTLRFLRGNLHGFDPARHALPGAQLLALDRWVLGRTRTLQAEVLEAYRKYTFHLIYQKVHNFCSVDLGGFYLDVIKDRMYTTPAAGAARRSAQTVMFHIAECMVRWLAPILSFTAEEVWRHLPGERRESVFHETWHTLPQAPADSIDWDALLHLRTDVTRALETLRDTRATSAPPAPRVAVHCEAEASAAGALPAAASGWRFLPLAAAIIVADQLIKAWMVQHFAPLERVHVLPVLDIILTYNTGAAFSFLSDASGWQRWLFVLLALGVSAALIVWLRRLRVAVQGLLACGLSLIVGGALGNMIDRLTLGRVVDFIHVHWR